MTRRIFFGHNSFKSRISPQTLIIINRGRRTISGGGSPLYSYLRKQSDVFQQLYPADKTLPAVTSFLGASSSPLCRPYHASPGRLLLPQMGLTESHFQCLLCLSGFRVINFLLFGDACRLSSILVTGLGLLAF